MSTEERLLLVFGPCALRISPGALTCSPASIERVVIRRLSDEDEIADAFVVAKAIEKAGVICSVGYAFCFSFHIPSMTTTMGTL